MPIDFIGRDIALYSGLTYAYLLLMMSLVSIALLASGGISIYFTYRETRAALASMP